MTTKEYLKTEKSIYHLDNYRPNIRRQHQFVPTDSVAGSTLTVDNFISRRYYKYHKCFVCGELMTFNQSRKITFCRLVHQSCYYES